jgi:DeoR/GlpR family transcriptional regulator of sugar metabolism
MTKTSASSKSARKDPRPKEEAATRLPAAIRRERILEIMRSDGFVSVARIAQALGVSQMSVRRDLDTLSQQGSLVRSHGAAHPTAHAAAASDGMAEFETRELQYETRRRRHSAAKQAIARCAAELVVPEDNLALDVGSTVLMLGRELAKTSGVRIFTNHVRLATLLAGTRCEVLMPGGIVRAQELSLCGQSAVDQVREHWFSKVFIGVGGLTDQGGFDASPEDTQVKRAYIERAEQVILLCDSSKFGRRSLAHACALEEIDVLITDAAPTGELARALSAARVTVQVATDRP